MARVALCDRCGAIIEDFVIKQISFELHPSNITTYDVCDKCYNELEEYMKINKKECHE